MDQIIVFIIIGVAAYLLIFLPQQRKTKQANAMLAALQEGDEVFLNSGIHGFISALDDSIAWVEVSPGIDLKISRSAIAGTIALEEDGED
ncbi:MAG: preprotein translocase subunit YajC [Acidimicrobiales bacterium]|jgi:preprotein translocase subunit YajC